VLIAKAQAVGDGLKFSTKEPIPDVAGLNTVIGLPFSVQLPDIEFIDNGNVMVAPFIHVGPSNGGVRTTIGKTLILVVNPVTQFLIGVKISG